jgi:acyl-coenzyme A thioesterase PaaI-like protein
MAASSGRRRVGRPRDSPRAAAALTANLAAVMRPPESGIDGVSGFFAIRWESATTTRMAIRPELINAGGMLSGVATYALVDYTMGSTLWAETTDEESIATLNIAINYVATATDGDAICTCVLDRRNRRAATLRGEVHHDSGRLMATAIGSYSIFPRKRSG